MKKLIVLLSIFIIVLPQGNVHAENAGYFGTGQSNPTSKLMPDTTNGDVVWTGATVYSCSTDFSVSYYGKGFTSSSAPIKTDYYSKTGLVALSVPSNARAISLYSGDGKEVYMYSATRSVGSDVGFNAGECSGSDSGSDPAPTPDNSEILNLLQQIYDLLGSELGNVNININVAITKIEEVNNNIINVNETLKTINNNIVDIKNELQTDQQPKKWTVPDYEERLTDIPQPDKPFEDKNVYFEDEGQAPMPPSMPQAPEPDKWDGVTDPPEFIQEEEQVLDEELALDEELEKDNFEQTPELEKDVFEKEEELNKDTFIQTPIMERDSFEIDKELSRDNFNQSPEMNRDQFNQNHQYEQTEKYNRDMPMEQTEMAPPVRWQQDEGVRKCTFNC